MTNPHTPPTPRLEDLAFVTGRGRYGSDIQADGLHHAAFVRAAEAPAVLTGIDKEATLAMDGVIAVLAAGDLGLSGTLAVNPIVDGLPQNAPLLCADRIGAVGEPVAIVLAQTPLQAADAAETVLLETDTGDPPDEGFTFAWQEGDCEAAFCGASHVCEVTTAHARLAPSAMEPRTVVAIPDGEGGLHVVLPSQSPWRSRDELARILGLDPSTVRVSVPDVGGAFGAKASLYPEDVAVTAAALAIGRPVRWVASRGEEFLSATHARGSRLEGRLGVDDSGRFLALCAKVAAPLGCRMPFSGAVPPWNAARILPGPYAVGAVHVDAKAAHDTGAAVGIYRGAGRPEAALLHERLVEDAAATLGIDPWELRRRNVITQFPHTRASGVTVDSGDLLGLIDAILEVSNWHEKRRHFDARRESGVVCGLGGALFLEPSGQGWESASARLAEDGAIEVATGTTCQGQGRRTVCRNVAARTLGVPHRAVRVLPTDTQHLERGIGALASRGTPIGLTALTKAVDGLKASMVAAAALRLNARPDDIVLTETGLAVAADTTRTIDRAALFGETDAITLTHTAEGETWGAGAVVAAVTVDTATGTLALEEIVAVDDAGRLIDPSFAHGQVVGGAVQGVGEAMMERIVYDEDGQLVTGSFMDYAVPRADDVPPIHSHTIQTPTPLTPMGAKGIGEAGTIGVPAAILNATLDALRPLGVRHLDFPLTPYRVWQALRTRP